MIMDAGVSYDDSVSAFDSVEKVASEGPQSSDGDELRSVATSGLGGSGSEPVLDTRSDTDPIDDLLPYNWIDTHAGQTMFEMSNIATAA